MEFSMDQAKTLLESGMREAQELVKEPSKVDGLLIQLEQKLQEVPAIGQALSDIPLMISLIKSYITRQYTNVSPKVILAVLGSFIYLVKKKDIIPDNVPVVGIADDLGVLTLALQLTQNELNAYKAWRDGRAAGDVIEPVPVEEAAADVRAAVQPEEKKSAASIIGDLAKKSQKDVSKVEAFLKEAGVFFLATADGDQPKLRALGAHFVFDGKLMFGVGDFKDVYKQLLANPKTEIVAAKSDGHWLRYTGRAVFETDPKYAAAALEAMPNLKNIYNEQTGRKMMMFHLEDAKAVDIPMMGEGEALL